MLVRLKCPARWPGRAAESCQGTATLTGAKAPLTYDVAAGKAAKLRFRLSKRRGGTYTATATNRDAAQGTQAQLEVTVTRPRR